MNSEYELRESSKIDGRGIVRAAAESFLANLPLLVCGMVIGFAVVMDMFA